VDIISSSTKAHGTWLLAERHAAGGELLADVRGWRPADLERRRRIPDVIEKGVPDLPTNAFFAYGQYDGIPRLLDLMDRHGIAFIVHDRQGGGDVARYRAKSSGAATKPPHMAKCGTTRVSARAEGDAKTRISTKHL
jgi:hypothetical protein